MEDLLSEANGYLIREEAYAAIMKYEIVLETMEHPSIRHNMAQAYEILNNYDEAISNFQTNIRAYPQYIRSYIGMANCYRHRKDTASSLVWLEKALEVDDMYPQTYFLLGAHYNLKNNVEMACHYTILGYIKSAQLNAKDSMHYVQTYMDPMSDSIYTCRIGSPGILSFLYCEDIPEDDIFLLHKFFDQCTPLQPVALKQKRRLGAPIRVGYISENIKNSPQISTLLPILEHHDTDNLSIYVYNIGDEEDKYTERVKSIPNMTYRWFERLLDLDAIRGGIAGDDLDILVSLDGHTCSSLCMKVMHEKVAKVHVDFLGYPFSTMKDSMDYKIVDDCTDPKGYERMYSEILLKPNPCFLVWKPLVEIPSTISYSPNTPRRILSPNNFMKLSKTTIQLYTQILDRCSAHLYVKSSSHESGTFIQDFFRDNFSKYLDRIHFITFIEDTLEHYLHTGTYDVVLDTTPYNGTVTTLESLYCNVPVVTLCGSKHRSRVSTSILKTIGHPELVTETPQEYVNTVVNLLKDEARLEAYHQTLRKDLESSSIMQCTPYVKNLEKSYYTICSN
jgi:protein O-GlcNAc transferase